MSFELFLYFEFQIIWKVAFVRISKFRPVKFIWIDKWDFRN